MPVLDGIKEGILLDAFPLAQQGLAGYFAGTIARFTSIPLQVSRLRTQMGMAEMARFQKANPGVSKEELLKVFRSRQMNSSFWKDMRVFQSEGLIPSFGKAATKSIWTVSFPFVAYENVRDWFIWRKQTKGETINWQRIYHAGALGGLAGGLILSSTLPSDFAETVPKLKETIATLYPDEHNAKLRTNLFNRHTLRVIPLSMVRQTIFLTSMFAYYDLFKYFLMSSPETAAEKIQALETETLNNNNAKLQDPLVYQIEKVQEENNMTSSTWFERLQKRSRFFETSAPISVSIPSAVGATVIACASTTPIVLLQMHASNLKNPMPMKECFRAVLNTGFRGGWRTFVLSSISNVAGFAPMLLMYEHFKPALLPRGVGG